MEKTAPPEHRVPLILRAPRFRLAAAYALLNAAAITSVRILGHVLAAADWFPHLAATWIVFFVIGSLFSPPQLELTREGFSFTSALRHGFVRWADVSTISVRRIWFRHRVRYEYPASGKSCAASGPESPPAGTENSIPQRVDHLRFNYGLSVSRLAAVMNDFRQKYGSSPLAENPVDAVRAEPHHRPD